MRRARVPRRPGRWSRRCPPRSSLGPFRVNSLVVKPLVHRVGRVLPGPAHTATSRRCRARPVPPGTGCPGAPGPSPAWTRGPVGRLVCVNRYHAGSVPEPTATRTGPDGGTAGTKSPTIACVPRTAPDMPKGAPRVCGAPLERISAAEGEPVDVHEVGRLAAGERQVHVVRAGHGADVRRDRPPRLPAAGVADRET